MKGKKNVFSKSTVMLISLYLFYSIIGIIGKYNAISSRVGSLRFFLLFGIQLFGIALFSIGWQLLLKKFELNYVYLFKGTTILWGLLFSKVIFHEQITVNNLMGAIIIVVGIGVVLNE